MTFVDLRQTSRLARSFSHLYELASGAPSRGSSIAAALRGTSPSAGTFFVKEARAREEDHDERQASARWRPAQAQRLSAASRPGQDQAAERQAGRGDRERRDGQGNRRPPELRR